MDREQDDYDILTATEVCRFFSIDDRTLRRWVSEKCFPKPTKFGKHTGWRRGLLKRWMDATEFLQGIGLTSLPPTDGSADEETAVDEQHADSGQQRTANGQLRTSSKTAEKPASQPKGEA